MLWRLSKKGSMVFDPDIDIIFVFHAGCWFAVWTPPESPSILTASNLMSASASCPLCWRKREGSWRNSHTPHISTWAPHPHPILFTVDLSCPALLILHGRGWLGPSVLSYRKTPNLWENYFPLTVAKNIAFVYPITDVFKVMFLVVKNKTNLFSILQLE